MRLPTSMEVTQLYVQYHTPAHIQDHMRMVAAIASELAKYHSVSGSLVESAALLHDLVRLPEQWPYLPARITTPLPHAEINYLILQPDYPEVATIIRSHSLMTILNDQPFGSADPLAAQILYYADKRVNHDQIVSLAERLELGQERWQVSEHTNRRAELLTNLHTLETSLFSSIPYDPNQLQNHLSS